MEAAHGITNTVRGVEEAVEAVNQNFEPFELQPSIIDAVVDTCPEHEAEEIWRVVGHSLVEQARDLLEEVRVHLRVQCYYAICSLLWCALLGISLYRRKFFWRYGDS